MWSLSFSGGDMFFPPSGTQSENSCLHLYLQANFTGAAGGGGEAFHGLLSGTATLPTSPSPNVCISNGEGAEGDAHQFLELPISSIQWVSRTQGPMLAFATTPPPPPSVANKNWKCCQGPSWRARPVPRGMPHHQYATAAKRPSLEWGIQ